MIKLDDRIKILDPSKFNRGQLIHSNPPKTRINDSVSNHYSTPNDYNSNVEDLSIENAIFCDWFEVTLSIGFTLEIDGNKDSIQLSESLFLDNTEKRTKHYNHVWTVIYMGEEFGTLQTNPRQSYMDMSQAQFKIHNRFLYQSDWLDIYKEILSLTKWVHVSHTRGDICVDGVAGDKAILLLGRHEKGHVVGMKGRAKITHEYLPNKKTTGYRLGSSKSEKQGTIYSKSDELKNSKKDYIPNAWNHNNLSITGDVKRFELRLRSKILKSYDWTRFDDPEYLASILRTECKNWFEFYYLGKDKNKYRTYKNNSMEWMDWDKIRGELLPKTKAIATSGMHRAKRVIKDMLYLSYVEDKEIPHSLIKDLKDTYNLYGWYDKKVSFWVKEWDREKKYKDFQSN